jgi:hypothetical protein
MVGECCEWFVANMAGIVMCGGCMMIEVWWLSLGKYVCCFARIGAKNAGSLSRGNNLIMKGVALCLAHYLACHAEFGFALRGL